jgi:uncharacterized MAPEG superfamily protein
MTLEILMLVLSGGLSLLLAVLTIAVHFARYGGRMIRSNRDDFPPLEGLALRVVRAHANLNEALLPFAIVVLAAALTGVSNPWTVYGAIVFFGARLPWRSLAYYAGLAATVVVAAQLRLGDLAPLLPLA